jgi:ubiquinone/menaquinone biosynthesis C-methylase UbiE
MSHASEITRHYERGDLLERLRAALLDDGVDPNQPTIEALAPFDHFHGRGLEATEELASGLEIMPADHILDVGSGIGGPARYLANRFGCRVTGIDLTEEFCEVARHVTRILGLEDRVTFEQGNALAMPFDGTSFDGAYSMNVSMNIADKSGFYGEIYRVLRPGGWLVLSELALGPNGDPDYPTPWARTADSSFLVTSSETIAGLESSGFTVVKSRDTVEENLEFSARSRAMVERGEKPPHRAVHLMHGDLAADAIANTSRGYKEARLVPIEVFCSKPDGG